MIDDICKEDREIRKLLKESDAEVQRMMDAISEENRMFDQMVAELMKESDAEFQQNIVEMESQERAMELMIEKLMADDLSNEIGEDHKTR
jgi:uncharacterized iron-regulated protein